MPRYLSRMQLAHYLKVSVSTVDKWRRSGRIPPPTQREGQTLLYDRDSVFEALGMRYCGHCQNAYSVKDEVCEKNS